MSFKEIIRLISERHTDMTEVTDALSDMMHTVKDRLPEVYKETMYCLEISIHAPRAGSDSENSDHYPDFQIILVWLFVSGRIWLLILNISQSM